MRQILINIYRSFPVQLFFLHFRKHFLLITLWVTLALLMSGGIAKKFGFKYLFLDPEYIGEVSFWSYLFIGITFGGFVMTWNITTYLLNSFRFPFLASLSKPFLKYCINNSLLPFLFIGFYFGSLIHFQYYNEFACEIDIISYCLGFLVGVSASIVLNIYYFRLTNKDILKFMRANRRKPPGRIRTQASERALRESKSFLTTKEQKVKFYLTERFHIRLVRSVAHYQPKILLQVFKQNHINALVYQVLIIVLLCTLGMMMDSKIFRIPAGASLIILFAFIVSISGALKYWLRDWRIPFLIIVLAIANFTTATNSAGYKNKVYGIDYENQKAAYNYEQLEKIASTENIEVDKAQTIEILNNWKAKNYTGNANEELPKMVFFAASGGGMRAALWATQVLYTLEKSSNGTFMKHTALMTGASGGMIGSTYMRDVYLNQQKKVGLSFDDEEHLNRMSQDLQNAIAFTIITNDIFVPWMKFDAEGFSYRKDRGYIFEQQLRDFDEYHFKHQLKDYQQHEKEATIPLLFFTPTVVNDVRSLVISSQKVAYMMMPPNPTEGFTEIDGIDFGRFFEKQSAYDLRISSAVRMNATYPYILPNIHLPSIPTIEVMDAGFKDNYGIEAIVRFVQVFQEWIIKNTSGVVIIQVRGDEKIEPLQDYQQGVIERMINPIGVAGQFGNLQDYAHDDKIALLKDIIGRDQVTIVPFVYRPSKTNQRASMSFHLTTREKKDILDAIEIEENQKSLKQVIELLEDK